MGAEYVVTLAGHLVPWMKKESAAWKRSVESLGILGDMAENMAWLIRNLPKGIPP